MPIKIGENPERNPDVNKFIGKDGDGYRGKIIALTEDKKQAIIMAVNGGASVTCGKLYLVKEEKPENYPTVIREVRAVPKGAKWKIPN